MTNKGSFIDRTGEKHLSNEGHWIIILKYDGFKNCTVQFEDGTVLTNASYSNIINGAIKHKFYPSIFGVGYIGSGEYPTSVSHQLTHPYRIWYRVLERCYKKERTPKNSTYLNVSVCNEWKCFQNFAKWYEENWKPYMEGWEIDKDILVKNNKVYSPETCCFVPKEINKLFVIRQNDRGKYPVGVHKIPNGRFQARLNVDKSRVSLGVFDTPEEAFQAYKIAKEKRIAEVADKWKGKITEEVYQAMYNFKIEIND